MKYKMNKVERETKFKNGHWEIPLPFRGDSNPEMENNKAQATKRASWQRKKMLKDSLYHKKYVEFMEDLLVKGYAHKIPQNELETRGSVNYLCHHAVTHPHKPNKVRVVFDCNVSMKLNNSLNDLLIPGPINTNSLVEISTGKNSCHI